MSPKSSEDRHKSETDKLLWEQVSSKSRPVRPIGGVDRTLRLQHYYQSDDAHDLIGLVQHVYREDLRRFGYSYPGNGTTTPTWQRREVETRESAAGSAGGRTGGAARVHAQRACGLQAAG